MVSLVMIELTELQRQELFAEESPRVLDPGTVKTYVLVQAEVFERLRGLVEGTPKITGEMVDPLLEEEDRDDPSLWLHQRELGRKS
jgi:hypothetical protein